MNRETIATECKYSSGKDWVWGNQDGGTGNIGTVLSVEGSGQVLVCTCNSNKIKICFS